MPPFPVNTEAFTDFENASKGRYEEAWHLMMRKQQDYGPHAISRAPGGPLMGIAVRLHDKISRLAHLLDSDNDLMPENETLRDTMMDIANYGVIGMMVIDKKWPAE